MTAPECPACHGTGGVCSACGRAFEACECPDDCDPAEGVDCDVCGGTGEDRGEA